MQNILDIWTTIGEISKTKLGKQKRHGTSKLIIVQ
jgi:hypothetical protein